MEYHSLASNIARLQNMATNGRWLCAGVALINYLAGSPLLALLMIATFFLAILADAFRVNAFSLLVYLYGATIFFLSTLNVW